MWLKEINNKIEYQCFIFSGKASIIRYGNRVKIQMFVYKFEKEDFKKEKKNFWKYQQCFK